ncbi:MAG: Predicted signal-transduction protein containing cAMP-binding and CBS domains [uncultured Sulfurovum sp.]|uniref:Predicted signal-transduction protein containing cAMP-binding and CBS domains n=1 Tax=uncultured Sulfurovum sp. TaxID=269237 RepID=A0A6S6RZ98_9BACT|nr:MAG: Predicted signal-transduction protein containing cAMP-binding and CBS domains [uncultured Sulfurovum sp.]
MIALLETLKSNLPFSLLHEPSLMSIEKMSKIAYYPNGTSLLKQSAIADKLYFIIKGMVESRDDEELIDLYHTHDTFGGIELIKNQPSSYDYIVTEELICYEISNEVFLKICEENKAFKAYFFSSIVERMELFKEKKEYSSMSDLMVARVDQSLLHPICEVSPKTPIIKALQLMESSNASSLLIKNPEGYGIVTDTDFRHYILHKEEKSLKRIEQIQTYPMISVSEGELLFNILLLMTENSVKYLPVLNNKNECIGILELIDLLSFFSNQSHLITVQITKAQTLQQVITASSRIEVMVDALYAKGVKSRYIARLVSEMNKKMYLKLFELIIPKDWHNRCTLILLGSEGRSEQILRTDQDNALIFEEGFMPNNVQVIAQQFIETLDKIGFPRCEGNIMLINPKWCKEIDAYKQDIDNWLDKPSMEGFMDMAIFVDSISVAGVKHLHTELIAYLIERVQAHKEVLTYFVKPIENFESPLGLFSQFVSHDKAHKNEIDIKKSALFALVHGVRSLALEHGITATNTTLRIKALNNEDFMDKEDATDLMEALEVINTLRSESQLKQWKRGEKIDNYISLNSLGNLEKDLLKESLKSVNKFKKLLVYHFHLSIMR